MNIQQYFDEEVEESSNFSSVDSQKKIKWEQEKLLYQKKQKQLDIFDMNQEELEERYQNIQNQDEDFEDELITDNKIYSVQCLQGQEKQLCLQLSNKVKQLQINQILSISYLDKNPQFIYIEQLCSNMKNLMCNRIQLVDPNQISQIYSKEETQIKDKLSINQYVRIKQGVYQNDLGQVVDIKKNDRYVIKLIPRIDVEKGFQDFYEKRPIQKFLSMENDLEKDFISNNPKMFDKQYYHLKVYSIGQLIYKNLQYQLQEMSNFHDQVDIYQYVENQEHILAKSFGQNYFLVGEKVKYKEKTTCKIIGIDKIYIELQVIKNHQTFKILIQTQLSQIKKLIKENQEVYMLQGKWQGQKGIVLSINQDQVSVLLLNKNKIDVNINMVTTIVQQSSHQNQFIQQEIQSKFKKFQLVKIINLQQVGIVINVINQDILVVNTDNQLINTQQVSLELFNNKKIQGKSKLNENIYLNSFVQIIDGIYKDKRGEVKQIYKDFVFIFSTQIYQNQGIACLQQQQIILVSNCKQQINPRMKQDTNVGKLFIIQKGIYKSEQGRLLEVNGNKWKMQIKNMTQTLTKNEVIGDQEIQNNNQSFNTQFANTPWQSKTEYKKTSYN